MAHILEWQKTQVPESLQPHAADCPVCLEIRLRLAQVVRTLTNREKEIKIFYNGTRMDIWRVEVRCDRCRDLGLVFDSVFQNLVDQAARLQPMDARSVDRRMAGDKLVEVVDESE